jgi:integrase
MVAFGGPRPGAAAELVALEQRDIDRTRGVIHVRRQLVRGRLKQTKTRRSIRCVAAGVALGALGRLPDTEGQLRFPAPHGGHRDPWLRRRQWRRCCRDVGASNRNLRARHSERHD